MIEMNFHKIILIGGYIMSVSLICWVASLVILIPIVLGWMRCCKAHSEEWRNLGNHSQEFREIYLAIGIGIYVLTKQCTRIKITCSIY